MWYQKDWFTGIDYYNLKEKQIHVAEQRITKPVEQQFHEQTEIYYVKSGDADIWINGEEFHVQAGSFFCLYMHLFYHIETIRKPLHCVKVSFHIGLFMFLCFEKRQTRENEILMYGVQPILYLSGDAAARAVLPVCHGKEKKGSGKEAAGLECDPESSFGYEQDGFFGRIRTRS